MAELELLYLDWLVAAALLDDEISHTQDQLWI